MGSELRLYMGYVLVCDFQISHGAAVGCNKNAI